MKYILIFLNVFNFAFAQDTLLTFYGNEDYMQLNPDRESCGYQYHFSPKEGVYFQYCIFYDSVNPQIVRLSGQVKNKIKVNFWHYYDSNGRLRKNIYYPEDSLLGIRSEWNYDSVGKLISSYKYGRTFSSEIFYYSDTVIGNIEKSWSKNDKIYMYSQIEKGIITHYEYRKNDSVIDTHIQHYPNGSLLFEQYKRNGKKEGVWNYGIKYDGIWCKEDYKNDLLISICFSNGNSYKKLKEETLIEEFYPNGRLRLKGQIKGGRKYGNWKFYSSEGVLIGTSYHDDKGNCIGSYGNLIDEGIPFF